MSIARQLYQLQDVDLELESNEQALTRIIGQLGESPAVVVARKRLAQEQQRLDELRPQQHSLEWEVDDLTTKLAAVEEKLYGGRITHPKELANLQHDSEGLKSRRHRVEDKVLEIMEQISETEAAAATRGSELRRLEDEWQREQQQLSAEAEKLKTIIADLKQKRQLMLSGIDPAAVSVYDAVKRQQGRAVARVAGGSCRGCGISLTTAQLQQAKSENLIQCNNCGRILLT